MCIGDWARTTHMFTRSGLTPPHIGAGAELAIAASSPEVGSPVELRCRGVPRQHSRAPREYPSSMSAPACGYPVREYPVSTLANLSASPTPSARPRAGAYAPPRPRAAATYISISMSISISRYLYIHFYLYRYIYIYISISIKIIYVCVCVCVCACARARAPVCVCVCVCVCRYRSLLRERWCCNLRCDLLARVVAASWNVFAARRAVLCCGERCETRRRVATTCVARQREPRWLATVLCCAARANQEIECNALYARSVAHTLRVGTL
jgi:hypothetical protein